MKSSKVLTCINTKYNSDNLEIVLITVIRDVYDKPSTHTHNLHWIMAEKTLLYLEGSSTKSVNQLQQIVVNMSCAGF